MVGRPSLTSAEAVPGVPGPSPAGDGEALVSFGREICGDLASGLRREWLVTNGLGGYASGTLAGINSRRYHGLLVAALAPPVQRTVLVGGLVEDVTYDARNYALSTNEYADGTIAPAGYRYLQSFYLDGMLPVWIYAIGDLLIERRIWMQQGANTTYVRYRVLRAGLPVGLRVGPLVTYRDFHHLTSGKDWQPNEQTAEREVTITAFAGARPFRVGSDAGRFAADGVWYWGFRHREEAARGLDSLGDLYLPGVFSVTLPAGSSLTLTLTSEAATPTAGDRSLAAAQDRQRALLAGAGATGWPAAAQQLVLAADQFVVQRRAGLAQSGTSVIAGYHWFNDWGRDTMIALPGLTLATGRHAEAASILQTFAGFVRDGLLCNNFPDTDEPPAYNTADATLWFALAVHAYVRAGGDAVLVDELRPVLSEIVARHLAGTRFGIGVDPADGLLRAGEPGLQLTWMDAKVGDWVVTPRTGKPVEINALWYNALRSLAELLRSRDPQAAAELDAQADRVRTSFRARFTRPASPLLADVVDGPNGDDWTVRPNQIFAVSLPFQLLDADAAALLVEATGRMLLTSHGLRSLSPNDPAFRGSYGGDQPQRDGAYHQGPAWSWLLGPFAEAHFRLHGDRAAALALLQPLQHHVLDAGLGTVSELFDGDPPHLPRGCIAQAWSVAEALRVWNLIISNDNVRNENV